MEEVRRERAGAGRADVVLLVQYAREADHFVGVAEALRRMGVRCLRVSEVDADRVGAEIDAASGGVTVVVKDTQSPLARYALRVCAERGARARVRTALLMDGIVEYRNTFVNPWVEPGFLRPAPVDVVFAAGDEDAARLKGWGNRAVATGLPRLGASGERVEWDAGGGKVMVATARRAAFSDDEFEVLRGALVRVRDRLHAMIGAERVVWRLTEGLDGLLGVANDVRTLPEALRDCAAVLTTPSTLMIEAMLAGKTVGTLHPWETELWQSTPWVLRGAELDGELVAALPSLLSPSGAQWDAQLGALKRMHGDPEGRSAAEAVAERAGTWHQAPGTSGELKTQIHNACPKPLPPAGRASKSGTVRVVNLLSIDGSPVGGVTSWALRLAKEMARVRPEYEVRTLAVVSSPEALWGRGFDLNPDGTTEFCHLDPMMDPHERVEKVRAALQGMDPAIVLQNYADHCAMAALSVRAASEGRVRVISVAHTDVAYYRELAERYDQYDAAIGVSSSCTEWLRELSDGRPVEEIVYGVPVSERPRNVGSEGPLRLCYVGRLVEEQKRIGLLWEVVEGMERELGTRGMGSAQSGTDERCAYELHVVGDGPEMAGFVREAGRRVLRRGRVVVHGRQSMPWVERFVRGMDVSVLVSSYEGTSVTMLEAMGQGVVPCVTRVNSGVARWVTDGVNGIVVGVDGVGAMAGRLVELARDRARLCEMGRAAWERVQGASMHAMARAYAGVFDRVRERAPYAGGTAGCFMRPMDAWRWSKTWCDDAGGAADWCERVLRESGCVRVLRDPSADVLREIGTGSAEHSGVVFTSERSGPIGAEVLDGLRARGIAVAVAPMLAQDGLAARMVEMVRAAMGEGMRRIAVYGTGHHTRRCREVFEGAAAIFGEDRGVLVGFVDDSAAPWMGEDRERAACFGLPVVRLEDAERVLRPDCVILSSDAFEGKLWARSAGLRERGVRVMSMYGAGMDGGLVAGVKSG